MRRSCVPFATVISCGGIIACDRRHFSVARNVRWFRLLHSTLCVCVQSHGVDRNEVVGVKGRRTGGIHGVQARLLWLHLHWETPTATDQQ